MLLMNYLDRINVSNARLAGMQEDLKMTDVEWSAGISLFYVGYIISQVRELNRGQYTSLRANFHSLSRRFLRTSSLLKASLDG